MKKFTINQSLLKDALKRIKQGIPSKPAIPQLDNVLFNMVNPTLKIISSDLDITIQIEVACNVEIDSEEKFY